MLFVRFNISVFILSLAFIQSERSLLNRMNFKVCKVEIQKSDEQNLQELTSFEKENQIQYFLMRPAQMFLSIRSQKLFFLNALK